MGKKLRIGLLGGGRIGKLHGTNVQNFIPDAEVVILADPEHRHCEMHKGSR